MHENACLPQTQSAPAWRFNLEGTLVAFLGDDIERPRSLVLEIEQENIAICLPERLRSIVKHRLKLGESIGCVGHSCLDRVGGVVRFYAYRLCSSTSSLGLDVEPEATA